MSMVPIISEMEADIYLSLMITVFAEVSHILNGDHAARQGHQGRVRNTAVHVLDNLAQNQKSGGENCKMEN